MADWAKTCTVCGLWVAAVPGVAFAAPTQSQPVSTAFVAVNVLPMNSKQVLRNQTVLVEDGTIIGIGNSLTVPKDALVVSGNGTAYLSPGLADMHTHSDTAEDMKVFLANGVTTVLNMGDASNGFVARTRVELNSGKIPGPHVYVAFKVDGSPRYGHFFVTTPEEARWSVRLAKTNGYDFIKVYNDLSPECFSALVQESAAQHMAVVGHGVTRVGLRRQLEEGQIMIAHTEEFLYTVFTQSGDQPTDPAPDPREIPAAIAFVKRANAFVTADLNTFAAIAHQWGKPQVVDRIMQMPEVRYLSPRWRISWRRADYKERAGTITARWEFLRRFTKDMNDAGIPLIVGTDAPAIPGLVPGFSLHDDLEALEGAGLTSYQALATATRVPGEFVHRALGDSAPFGTITTGARADLVLSESNPLDDLSTLRRPLGVMANGKWYAAAELKEFLEQVALEYNRALRLNRAGSALLAHR